MTEFPTLDPELAAAVTMMPPFDFAHPVTARVTLDEMRAPELAELSMDGVSLRELAAPGIGDAPDVGIRLFTPEESGEGPLPVLLWIHGGGFVVGTAQGDDPFCVDVARQLRIAVASVDYRLAPETPFPGPHDDCWAALTYLRAAAAELGIDPERIAVGGQSAGGGLAASIVLRARDEGAPVAFQLLEIPELDDRLETVSMRTFVDTPVWHRPNAILSWQFYLGESYAGPSDPDVSPYAAPARVTDLAGLPPTYLCTMELDPLRDEGIDYAQRMMQAGVSVELHSFPGTFHGSTLIGAEVSKRSQRELRYALARGLRVQAPAS
ncbi:alpha/beta hydrolase [Nocardia harenae]|uniref:alpha/beta hydrolase n=1 Tax=Nocardia harenae TaxID=358707 RepID=UPI000835661C|nr:alpha/beta hydrolase [Nocardia harenae]